MTTQASAWLLNNETRTQLRPRYEGSNINTWMGFKHINYLVEEAVLDHFRACGLNANSLYEEHGLCLEIVDLETRISTSIHTDDVVEAVVGSSTADSDAELAFQVNLAVQRNGEHKKAARSRVRVQLRLDDLGGPADPAPDNLHPYITNRTVRTEPNPTPIPRGEHSHTTVLAELTRDVNAFAWCRRIPYFYCHFTERLQMSGYLRQMEEIVDLFLADRGISIKRLLDERGWIPVVTHSSISILNEVVMEEELYTVFNVENIFKNLTYTGRMDTYVLRNGQLLRTATGRITHGYAQIQSRRAIKLVEFDGRMLTALAGG